MPSPKLSKTEGKWDERLVCRVQHLSYDFRTRTGELHFPECNCCDMGGAVALFRAIDPDVRLIRTFAGGRPDTVYRFNVGDSGEWSAFLPRE